MIIGIVGSRRRDTQEDLEKVSKAFFTLYEEGDWICSGGCPRGGDRFAKLLHELYAIPYLEFPAQWKKLGRGAGFARNTHIAENSDYLIACVAEDRTGGTEDTVRKFLARNENAKERLILV